MELGLVGALVGGVLTLLSPCSVMLLPAFFSYAFTTPKALLSRTGIFYLGLITTLLPLGVLAGTLGSFVNQHRFVFVTVAGVVVVFLGVLMLANIPLPFVGRAGTGGGTSLASVFALGTMYGLAGVCAGPLLGAVLTLAALGGNAFYGGLVLLVFAAGMTVPLLVLAVAWGRLPFVRLLVRPREVRIGRWRNTWSGVIGGVLTVGVGGLLLLTSGTTALAGVLGASDQARLEGWIREETARIPDLAVAVVVLTAALVAWVLARRQRREPLTPAVEPVPSGVDASRGES